MAKGWKTIGTSDISIGNVKTREEKFRREEAFRKAIKNIRKRKEEEILREAEILFEKRQKENESLVQAFNEKKLKSASLIKKAKFLKKKKGFASAVAG